MRLLAFIIILLISCKKNNESKFSLKGTTNEFHKQKRIENDKAGSSCPKKYLALSKEFGAEGICTASKKYQDVKLQELEAKRAEDKKTAD